MKNILKKLTAAYLAAACMAAQPAFAAGTDISNIPLGAAAGAGLLPNLLFLLDDSGSMARDFNPDYVDDNNACMTTSGGATTCQRGDPPHEAGGANGFNGVGYDPNFTYLPGLTSTGQPIINPPSGTLTPTSVTPDAYLGGPAVNVTTSIPDRRFCNTNGVCKRNGADSAGVVPVVPPAVLVDAEGHVLGQGQFPYRTNASSASTVVSFALPEMMPLGTFSRTTTTVTATTVTAHGLTTTDRVFVTSGTAGLNVTCVPVTATPTTTTFRYTTGTSGNITSRTASYRKCGPGTFTRAGNVVTATVSTGHFVVTNDIVSLLVPTNSAFNVTNATITVTSATTFTYTTGTSGAIASTPGFGVRTGLYNVASSVNGPAISYGITPVEWCSDVNLTACKEFIPPIVPPAKPTGADSIFSNPAYVRFCKTQADALAPGAVTGTSIVAPAVTPTNRCQLKFVNQTGLTQYIFPRYGWFNRDTIAPGLVFKNRRNRSDCITPGTTPDCTYTEEIQNYSKWFAYYHDRMLMMKTSAGRSFLPFISNPTATPSKPDRLRVGFITINPGSPVVPGKYLKIDTFNNSNPLNPNHVLNWYKKFYDIVPNASTPLREALSRAGWIFSGRLGSGLTDGIPAGDDPVQASCQRNYSFLTTDGFWNQGTGSDLGTPPKSIGNQDNVNNDTAYNSSPDPNPYGAPSPKFFVSRASGTWDGAVNSATAGTTPGGSGTLADIAMYYYRTDLRGGKDLAGNTTGPKTSPSTTPPGGDVSVNNVSAKSASVDFATHQRMNTFTIGLADGLMRYQPDYATDTNSDFFHIVNADVGKCFWNGPAAPCNWPTPLADGQSALDDLWHAAVNGRGSFYSAVNPASLATGLSSALNSLDINVASAAAAATSSPQVAQGDARAFSTTYQTSTWSGEVYAQKIKAATGEVDTSGPNNGKLWEAHRLLVDRINGQPFAIPPIPPGLPRVLKTFDVGDSVTPQRPSKLKDFDFASLSSGVPTNPLVGTEQAQFRSKCTTNSWAQCTTLAPADKIIANDSLGVGTLVKFLSGDATNEGAAFRDRATQDQVTGAFGPTVLGDIINAQPVAVGAPFFEYQKEATTHSYPKTPVVYSDPLNPSSTAFKEVHAKRKGFLLVGANDGFLHAFDQATGEENWAYVPRFLLPNLYQLADTGYPGQHRFYVDGTPEVGDVFDTAASAWKTIVVGGLNSGGRGFYALDITIPTDPKGLWEFCSDPDWCPADSAGLPHSDRDLGFSYGNPVIGRRESDGKWVVVVTSGLNNVPSAPGVGTGDGKGYFYVLDAITGQILHKVTTGAGDAATPSGLMKIGAYYPEGLDDPNFTYVYGGDQQGNVWRLDMKQAMVNYTGPTDITTGSPSIRKLATLKDASGRVQPITARPAGTHIGAIRIYYVGTGRYLGNSDLTDLGAGGIAWQQSIYGIRDELSNPDGSDNAGFTPLASFRDGEGPGKVVRQVLSQLGPDRTISKNPVDWKTQSGFFIDLNPTFKADPVAGNSPGERVFLDVRLIQGTLIITSNVPAAGGACVPGGTSFQYGLDFRTGGYVGNNAAIGSGQFISQFLVGAAIIQTSDDQIKALNKSITGENLTTSIPIDTTFIGKRFSYRER